MITHLVIGKPREGLSDAEQRELDASVEALGRIGAVHDMTWGHDFSGRGQGYSVAAVIHFTDRDALQTYQVDPEHRRIVGVFDRIMPNRLVLDYETESSGIST